MPGTLEFAVNRLVEKHMDLSIFDGKYKNDETGRPAYDPKILLKVVLLGYSRGLISSRKIEQACKENIVFMALSCGQYPDYTTIATFVSTMKNEIQPLFRNILLVCEEMDLLGGTFFAQDGCKLPSNASKQWSGKVSDLKRKKAGIEEKVRKMLKEQEEEDRKDDDPTLPSGGTREKQIEKLTKQAQRIEAWLKENMKAAQQQERAARADADYAAERLARFKALYAKRSIAKDTLDQASSEAKRANAVHSSAKAQAGSAGAELSRTERVLESYGAGRSASSRDIVAVQSPVSGRVLRLLRESEGAVDAGESLMEVGNPYNLEVRVEVLSSDAVKIGKGTPVLFEHWGGDVPLAGVVRVVEPGGFTKVSSLGVEEQRVVVIVDFTTLREVWDTLGDAYRLDASFITWEGRDVLQVPASAAFRSGKGWAVFAVENKRARLRSIQAGHSNGLSTEILSGLKPGEPVITHPDDTIRDGTRVQQNKT